MICTAESFIVHGRMPSSDTCARPEQVPQNKGAQAQQLLQLHHMRNLQQVCATGSCSLMLRDLSCSFPGLSSSLP